ncbi:11008_t:CDS:1, partial [Funneliformis geosporum]
LALFYDIDAHKKSLLENPLATHLSHLRLGNNKLIPIQGLVLLIDNVKKLTLHDFRYLLKELYNKVQVKETKDRLLSHFPITFNYFDPVTGKKKTERFWLNCSQIFSYNDIHYLLTAPYSNTDQYRKLRCGLLALAKAQIGDSIKSD